jgi:itaconyl-CoA hydratase
VSALTGTDTWFEDYRPGDRWRSARGTTVGEVENQLLTKLVLNTAQAHFNDHVMQGSPMGDGRLVFGLVTGSIVIGLATQDTAENALVEVGLDKMRFTAPVHHGDTLYALTEVVSVDGEGGGRSDAGLVVFRHWGIDQDDRLVFEAERTVLVRKRST